MLTGLSRAASADLVASGAVLIAGRPVTTRSARVQGGQRLAIRWEPVPAAPAVEADPAVPVTVVHADADVIVVDKAPGLVVHPGNGVQGATLVAGLLARFPELDVVGEEHRPGIVHGSTGGRRACWSWPAAPPPTTAWSRRWPSTASTGSTGRW